MGRTSYKRNITALKLAGNSNCQQREVQGCQQR